MSAMGGEWVTHAALPNFCLRPIADIPKAAKPAVMHLITEDNYNEATDAVRDILLMYVEMAHGYEGFGHAVDYAVRFDRLKFVDAEVEGRLGGVMLDLLHEGSAMAVLCFFYDLWCEENHLAGPHTQPYVDALDQGRLRAFPDIEKVIRESVGRDFMSIEDEWFEAAVVPIYRKYVLGYFSLLAGSDRSAK